MDNLKEYAIIVIYPDGLIEDNKVANYKFHMTYFVKLANNSERLMDIFKKNDIDMEEDYESTKECTYSTDAKLAKEGIIVLHNMALDDETLNGFYITVPTVINDIQREILNKILDGFDIHDWWFGYLEDDEIIDVSFDDFEEMYGKMKK